MRSEEEMYELILNTAREDDRVRAVILNGSRANPSAPRDIFQDFDIAYLVTDVASFKNDPDWIKRFGEIMILQTPDDMGGSPSGDEDSYAYLMQFMDGNRIDLTLYPLAKLDELEKDSLSILLLDKDGVIEPFPPPDESDYLPKPPRSKEFSDCCNEFWWVCPYVAKGLWRGEIIYAKSLFEQVVREQLMIMLVWHIGVNTHFSQNPGKFGKYFQKYLEPESWDLLEKTYADASYEHTWEALFAACDLFRKAALPVAVRFGFDYPQSDDERVYAFLEKVRGLPKNSNHI
jgi:aminoglycoside 6-adenylyltransferase